MKLRAQIYIISLLMILTMLSVVIVEAGLWRANQKQTEKRNYVALCLKDVFELNLLTHELNLFRDTARPIRQMDLKLKVLSERFQKIAVKDVFSTSEVEAIQSTLESIHDLLKDFRGVQAEKVLPGHEQDQQALYDRIGAQLLQRAQTLYGAFTLMAGRLSRHEMEEEYLQRSIRIGLFLLMGFGVAATLFFLYRSVVQSFALLEAGATEVSSGNMAFKFNVHPGKKPDEIGAVKNAFNSMVTSLQEAVEEIKKKNRELETLLYVISHDLKEPLRSVEYFSKAVHDRCGSALDPEAQDYLCRSVQGAVRLRSLLDDILVLSKARKIALQNASVPIQVMVEKALERLERKIKETDAQVTVADHFPSLKVDPIWVQEAIFNLISNALKYALPGQKPQIEILSYRSEGAASGEAGIVVQDRGPGVSPEIAERVFDLFQRGVGRDIEGTGAGLAIVKVVAERHGGRAWVEPREGGGARFIITFKV